MAACELTIKINDDKPRSGGEVISGVVIVRATKDVVCRWLAVRTIWATHGRGNVDTGEVAVQSLFQGSWQAGQEYTYPFTLVTPLWPPTYYGNYLNVSHHVAAQASLSWAVDPKAQVEYRVVAQDSPDDLNPTVAPAKPNGIVVAAILGALAVLFLFAFIPLLVILAVVVAPIAGLVYFIKFVLPKRVTGPVTCELATAKVRAGQELKANLIFTPARRSTINGIDWQIRCIEECVSGSGSDRRTHTNELFQDTVRSSDARELKPGEKMAFELNYTIPPHAASSLKFPNNKLKWTVAARIDIPRWPDWTKTLEPVVVADPGASLRLPGEDEKPPVVTSVRTPSSVNRAKEKTMADEAWLKQVIAQIQQTQHEEDAIATVLEAVKDFAFPIVVTIENEIDTPEFGDEATFRRWDDAEWWSAYCPAQNIDMAVAWEDGYPPEVGTGKTWQGQASIIGYEVETKQLLMAVI